MAAKEINYKALRAELDEILAQLDDTTLDVEEMTKQFERGMHIVIELETYLKAAQNRVTKIKQIFSDKTDS